MKISILTTVILILFGLILSAEGSRPEKHYQAEWCKDMDGIAEYILEDKTRVDCLTKEYAVEVDFAKKWAEAIGQSLYYAIKTGKKPAVLLIVGTGDERYLERLKTATEKTGITVWVIEK